MIGAAAAIAVVGSIAVMKEEEKVILFEFFYLSHINNYRGQEFRLLFFRT